MPSRTKEEDIEVDEAPTSINPYDTLGISKDATSDQVKSAYRKQALTHHPDKAPPSEKDSAHTKFQEIAFAYAVLSDERRRKRYDTTGRTDEAVSLEDDDFDWADFFRAQFAEVVTEEKIRQFEQEYKGSDEEKEHVLAAYEKFEGDMRKLYEEVMLSDMLGDEDRFRTTIDQAIRDTTVEAYDKYTKESDAAKRKRMAAAQKKKDGEAKEADKAAAELKAEGQVDAAGQSKGKAKKSKKGDSSAGMGDLAALIQQRQKGRAENFFDNLEAKYGAGGGQKRGSEPPEEMFEANRKKSKSSADTAGSGRKGARTKK